MTPRLNLVFLLVLMGCGPGANDEDAGSEPAATLVPVHMATVIRDSISDVLEFTGRLSAHPGGAVQLTAPATGVVRQVAVQLGDRVRPGTTIATIEVPELAADASQKSAAATVAQREAVRQQQLLKDGITSARQADEAMAASGQATAAAQAANALLARTRMTSPIGGRVQSVDVQVGAQVEAGAPVARIVSVDTLDLTLSIPAASLRRVRPGMSAAVLEEGADRPVAGFVAGVAPGVDSLTGAGTAVIRIPNRGASLHPGAAATAALRLDVHRQVLVVPDSALVLAGDSTALFVIRGDSIAHQVMVRTGVRMAHRVEVEGQLQAGDHVVTAGAFGLEDGMRVVTAPDSASAIP
jgi:membrane fusion protein (multidrug efflux system)